LFLTAYKEVLVKLTMTKKEEVAYNFPQKPLFIPRNSGAERTSQYDGGYPKIC